MPRWPKKPPLDDTTPLPSVDVILTAAGPDEPDPLPAPDPEPEPEPVVAAAPPIPEPTQMFSLADFGKVIGDAVAKGIAESTPPPPPRRVSFGEYQRRPTLYHPKGPQGPKMARAYSQNSLLLDYATTYDRDILLLNRITHSGRYIDRKVEVILNNDNAEESVDIRYHDRTADHRLDMKAVVRDFTHMLTQIVEAQEEEDREEQEHVDAKMKRKMYGPRQGQVGA